MSEWQPIDSAPRDGTLILVSNGEDVGVAGFVNNRFCWAKGAGWAWEGDGDYGGLADCDWTLTHWQPLPEPPHAA